MLRALLVDDEPLALEGLKILIDWQAEGFEICCECASGREALAKLPAAKPDLIVTDIRMPGISGLELLQAARRAGFDGQFVIVSGYNDFNYARNALRIGVAGYLLKPVEPSEAANVLAHVRHKLLDREAAANRRSQSIHRAINTLLTECGAPTGELPAAARWMLATWGAPLPYPEVQALLALFPPSTATAHIVDDKEYLVLRLDVGKNIPGTQSVEAFLAGHQRTLHRSEPTDTPADLHKLRKQLSDQLDMACRCAPTGQMDALIRAVSLRQADECSSLCREIEAFCAACGADALIRAKRQLLSACSVLLANRTEALKTFLHSQTSDLQTLCLTAIQLLEPKQELVSDRMERYARKHSSEPITVNSMATVLGYNPTYLGRKFNEERNIGFREWLSNLRIEQGACLLRSTDQSVTAIAKAVGFMHYKRFLRHFKQHYNMTPEQYRRQTV